VSGPLRPGDIGANAGGSQCDILPEAKREFKELCKQVSVDTGVYLATGGLPIRGLRGARNGAASIKGGRLAYNAASKTWTSPAGLVYGHGSVHGNRVKHVLDHLAPNPSKPTHLIFSVTREKLVGLIDDAWSRKVGPGVLQQPIGNRYWVVDMGRTIGTNGERYIRIVVKDGTNNVITCFPQLLP
jgi:hypothetical protein